MPYVEYGRKINALEESYDKIRKMYKSYLEIHVRRFWLNPSNIHAILNLENVSAIQGKRGRIHILLMLSNDKSTKENRERSDMKKLWTMKFNTATLVLIPAAIGINYLGKLFAGLLKLPLWLDSIGTCLAALLAGPIAGAIVGAVNNIIYGVTVDPISTIYALTNMAIGIVVGILAYKGLLKKFSGALIAGLLVGLTAVVVSTPLNLQFWGGTTGNIWGDAAFAACMAQGMPAWIASFVDEIIVDIPDKIAVLLIVYIIGKGLPKSLTALYGSGDEISKLV